MAESTSSGASNGIGMRLALLGVGLVAVASAVVAALVLFAGSGSAAPATAMAEHLPADTHFMVALNTDFASGPWLALPDLLAQMNVEDDAREGLLDSFEEEGLDYVEDIEPLLGVTRGIAITMQARPGALESAFMGVAGDDALEALEVVVLFDARDADQVIELLEGWTLADDPAATRTEERVDDLDLDVITYTPSPDSESHEPIVIGRRSDLVYAAPRLDHITSLIERREAQGPLSSEPNFGALIGALRHETLLFGYGNARAFTDAGPVPGLDELTAELGGDLDSYSMAFSTTATTDGFAGEFLIHGEDGLGGLEGPASLSADLARAATTVGADAQLYLAAPGLRESLEQALETLDTEATTAGFGDLREQFLGPVEADSGVDIETDIVEQLTGTWVLAGSVQDPDTFDGFVLFATESTQPDLLEQAFSDLVIYLNGLCGCDLGVGVGQADGFVRVAWPEDRLAPPPPAEQLGALPAYLQTLELLPSNPGSLMFFNLTALPPEAIEEMRSEADDFDIASLLGVGLASTQSGNLAHVSIVLPVGDE
ncbi:MAG: DUF3352 domain-containing protein [Dehalococcoidia bacterium]|nr:DUF3352 domain-containing protein [Dehalococcoidia bacterium]